MEAVIEFLNSLSSSPCRLVHVLLDILGNFVYLCYCVGPVTCLSKIMNSVGLVYLLQSLVVIWVFSLSPVFQSGWSFHFSICIFYFLNHLISHVLSSFKNKIQFNSIQFNPEMKIQFNSCQFRFVKE